MLPGNHVETTAAGFERKHSFKKEHVHISISSAPARLQTGKSRKIRSETCLSEGTTYQDRLTTWKFQTDNLPWLKRGQSLAKPENCINRIHLQDLMFQVTVFFQTELLRIASTRLWVGPAFCPSEDLSRT